MGVHAALRDYLAGWTRGQPLKAAVAETVINIAKASVSVSRLAAQGPLADPSLTVQSGHCNFHEFLAGAAGPLLMKALEASPVGWVALGDGGAPELLKPGAPFAVNIEPIHGACNLDANAAAGTIFSILPSHGPAPLLQPGRDQVAAGYVIYGPQTVLVLTVGEGTHMFWLDPSTEEFVLVKTAVQIPLATREYAIDAANFHLWDDATKAYIIDCTLGIDGPRCADFNTHWTASLVAESFRILTRGGICLYPQTHGQDQNRPKLVSQANPIAMLTEQAGGACTDGTARTLDIEPASLQQLVAAVFGSKIEVEEVAHYYNAPHSSGNRSPLFAQRGLFRTVRN